MNTGRRRLWSLHFYLQCLFNRIIIIAFQLNVFYEELVFIMIMIQQHIIICKYSMRSIINSTGSLYDIYRDVRADWFDPQLVMPVLKPFYVQCFVFEW